MEEVNSINGVFVAAHELKAPLSVMRQLAFSLGDLSPEDEIVRGEMIEVSERALRQVNDLVKVARLEDGLFEMEPVSVRATCDEVIFELRRLFEAENSGVRVKYRNKIPLIYANRDLFSGVVYNFLINALHYANDGSLAELKVRDRGEKVRIEVRDFGPQLPAKIWREIRNEGLTRPTEIAMRPGSTGMGLFIASKFTRYMNGEIGAVRHKDGTSFFVEMPMSRQRSLFE